MLMLDTHSVVVECASKMSWRHIMSENGKTRLLSLLFGAKVELNNVKFFPGTGRGLTAESLGGAAADAIEDTMFAWTSGVPSSPPTTGRAKQLLIG
jgi:hypothetical protein